MSNRITQKDLQNVVDRINQATGHELKPYQDTAPYSPNPNVYHLDHAYGGVCLVQMMDEGSGVRSILPGFGTKRELFDKMNAFLGGIETASIK